MSSSDTKGYDSVNFDGSNDKLRVPDNASLDLTTWEIFIVTKANAHKNYNAIITKGSDTNENYKLLTYGDAFFHTPVKHTDGSRTFKTHPLMTILQLILIFSVFFLSYFRTRYL